MVDMAHIAGLVAGEQHPSPVPWADFVTSTTHKTLRGPRGGFVLCKKDWAAKINQAVFPGMQGGPLMHVIAAKAVGFGEALQPAFRAYAAQIVANARTLAHELSGSGFRLVSGGTDNHLMLVDVTSRGLTGKVAEKALDAAGITVNRNSIPFDTRPPLDPSGIRIGTPALTTRGMRETGDAADRGVDRRGAGQPRRRRGADARARPGARNCASSSRRRRTPCRCRELRCLVGVPASAGLGARNRLKAELQQAGPFAPHLPRAPHRTAQREQHERPERHHEGIEQEHQGRDGRQHGEGPPRWAAQRAAEKEGRSDEGQGVGGVQVRVGQQAEQQGQARPLAEVGVARTPRSPPHPHHREDNPRCRGQAQDVDGLQVLAAQKGQQHTFEIVHPQRVNPIAAALPVLSRTTPRKPGQHDQPRTAVAARPQKGEQARSEGQHCASGGPRPG